MAMRDSYFGDTFKNVIPFLPRVVPEEGWTIILDCNWQLIVDTTSFSLFTPINTLAYRAVERSPEKMRAHLDLIIGYIQGRLKMNEKEPSVKVLRDMLNNRVEYAQQLDKQRLAKSTIRRLLYDRLKRGFFQHERIPENLFRVDYNDHITRIYYKGVLLMNIPKAVVLNDRVFNQIVDLIFAYKLE